MSWLQSFEEDGAVNGYSLTRAHDLKRESMIEFASGELLYFHCTVSVKDGKIDFSIGIHGNTPIISDNDHIIVDDYMEDYIQMNMNQLFGFRKVIIFEIKLKILQQSIKAFISL